MVLAGGYAAFHSETPPVQELKPSMARAPHEEPESESEDEQQAPPIDPHAKSPHETAPAASIAPNKEEDAVSWKVPEKWRTIANPSTMRIATYRISGVSAADEAEMSVARAGGSIDDNIERWVGQFEDSPKETRTVKKVHGVKVTIVEIAGTYQTGGMGGAPASHPGWSLLAAIVETAGSPYFFKLTGPAATTRAARPAFDALVDSITPSSKPL